MTESAYETIGEIMADLNETEKTKIFKAFLKDYGTNTRIRQTIKKLEHDLLVEVNDIAAAEMLKRGFEP